MGSAALIGALIVGDSVRGSLREQASQRLGWVDLALAPADRFFTAELGSPAPGATNASAAANSDAPFSRVTAALRLPATAARQDGAARANQVQVHGVRKDFWPTSLAAEFAAKPAGAIWINEALAAQLNARPGDGLVVRVHKPSALSREVPITPQADASVALRFTVHRIVAGAELGNFSLRASPGPSWNAFVDLDELDAPAGLDGKANLVLASLPVAADSDAGLSPVERASAWLAARVRLQDYGLAVRPTTNEATAGGAVELTTDRIFLEADILRATAALTPATPALAGMEPRPLLTYLVNQLRHGNRLVPYSMVTAAGPPWTPADLKDDEIVVNRWLADQLAVGFGDTIELAYFLPESGASLVERTNRFRVRSIVPIEGVHGDRTLLPAFPGLAEAESTHDWDAGFPLVHKIRDEDEAYWKQHRGTPKAFVTWPAGQGMWTNRFGVATAVRWASTGRPSPGAADSAVAGALRHLLDPAEFGLAFEPVRAEAAASSAPAQDFGGLFLGFSFFLILAALILMALLFQFALEQRTSEVGTLLAVGFAPGRVRRLLLVEGTALALVGGLFGVAGGVAYARAMLEGLTTIWRDAIGGSSLHFHITPLTLAIGLTASVAVCAVTIALVLRKQARRPARELLADGAELGPVAGDPARGGGRLARGCAIGGAAGGLGLIGWALAGGGPATPPVFFGAGSLLLISGLGAVAWLLRILVRAEAEQSLTLVALGLRNATRRRARSLASVALLASGSFLIVAVGANRLDADRDATARSSGTGGFSLIGESALPVLRNLNTSAGREFYGLADASMSGVSVVSLRVRDGDEASCLNLNQARTPRLLGVRPEELAARGAFTFAGAWQPAAAAEWPTNRWLWLKMRRGLAPDEIPAIGDAASIQWAMKKKLGDTLDYTDERGRPFRVRLVGAVANSILQGSLLIDEAAFVARFPGESGHRMLLVDVPSNQPLTNVAAALSRALQDVGLQVTPAARRLAEFNAVQNTYLNTFQILGGLGLLLGSAGLGVVVLRNVLERRAELGLLLAVGFRRRRLQGLVLCEHGGLLALGLAVGLVAALVAVLPVLLVPGARLHTRALALTLGGVLVSGGLWTWLATRWALRGRLIDAVRRE